MTKFPPLVQKVFDYCVLLNKEGPYFTGSRAIGVETSQSDWDIVMEIPNEDIVSIARNMCTVFSGESLTEGQYVVNILNDRFIIEIHHTWLFGLLKTSPKIHVILENADYCNIERWKLATEYCKENKEISRDKKERIKIFEYFGVPNSKKPHGDERFSELV